MSGAQARLPLLRPRNPLSATAEALPLANGLPLPLPSPDRRQRENLRGLPKLIVEGLRVLRDRPAPNVTRPDLWNEIATDAVLFAFDGWAGEALSLGWTTHQVFGCAAARKGDDYLLGITGRLTGRRVLGVSGVSVTVKEGGTSLSLARPRQHDTGVVYLWEYGR